MKKVFLALFFLLTISATVVSQSHYSWVYNAGGSGDDQALAVTADNSGNIYVAGYFNGTVNFGGANSLTSAGDKDLFLVKLNSSGVVQWAKKGGGTAADQAIDVKCDAAGNVYTLGWHEGSATFGTTTIDNTDGAKSFITKWDNNGNVLSVIKLGGYVKSFVLDGSGNIYVASTFSGTIKVITTTKTSQGGNDMYIAKLTSAGVESWVKTVWSSGGSETPIALALTPGDSLLVTGRFGSILNFEGSTAQGANNGGATSEDLFLAKYSNGGNFVWFKQFDGAMANVVAPNSITTDAAGSIYLAGTYSTSINFYANFFTNSGGTDLFVAKLSSDGATALWAKKVGGASDDAAFSIGLDNSNNVYFTGCYSGNLTFETTNLPNNTLKNIYLAKYNTTGTFQWVKNAGGNTDDGGLGMKVMSDGSALVCGNFTTTAAFHGTNVTSNGGNDMFVAKSTVAYTPLLTAAFTATPLSVMAGSQVTFTDQSVGTPNGWAWSFPGGTADTSNIQNPVITYNTPGTYSVTLAVANALGETNQLVKTDYITVTPYVSNCNAVQFDGIDDHIDCGSRSGLRVNQGFTIEAWVKPELESGYPFSYMTKTATSVNGYAIGYYNGKLRFVIQPSNMMLSDVDNMPGANIPLNQWSHVACSYNGLVAKIYVNGVLAESKTLATTATSITWSTNPAAIYIGKCVNTSGTEYFKGAVDEVRIWKSTRTEAEINTYKDLKLVGTEANLGVYWSLNEGTATTANDGTVNNYDGTLKNGTAWITTTNACYGLNVQEVGENQQLLMMYPNPANESISFENKYLEPVQVTILDISGKSVGSYQLQPDQNSIDISNLTSGIYFVQILNNQTRQISKFVKK
jgi:PKD repeat protein